MTKILAAVAFLGLNFYTFNYFANEASIPARESFEQFPLELGKWSCPGREPLEPEVEKNLGVTEYLVCTYVHNITHSVIGVYIGYHEDQHRVGGRGGSGSGIHPPKHCLPGSGWDIIGANKVAVDYPGLPERPTEVMRLLIAKGEERQLVYYWYQERGRVIADDWKKPLYMFWDRATRHRSDGSLVRFTIPVVQGDDERADKQFQELAELLLPHLSHYVPE